MPHPSPLRSVKNFLIGRERELTEHGLFHKLSLVALLAWVGLGADGLSSSCYGPEETYKVMNAVRRKYDLEVTLYFPEAADVENLVRGRGPNLFYDSVEDRKRCCHVRKVLPLGRALRGLRGWVTGQRRDQSVTRTTTPKVERDLTHGQWKVNPLASWTSEDVWSYIRAHGVPYNRLHDAGYPSIGCAPCTRAVAPGAPERSGRWWWEDASQKECGLHLAALKEGVSERK